MPFSLPRKRPLPQNNLTLYPPWYLFPSPHPLPQRFSDSLKGLDYIPSAGLRGSLHKECPHGDIENGDNANKSPLEPLHSLTTRYI